MKKLYWIAIMMGVVLTPYAHKMATKNRGYSATGGEVLLIPFFLLVAMLIEQLWEMGQILKGMYIEDKIVFKKEKSQ